MNAPVIVLLVACVLTAVWYFRERNLDRADALAPYHLMHGPNDGCPECERK